MNKSLICSALIIVLGVACTPTEKPAEKNRTLQNTWDEVMLIHDEVMPKMSDLTRLKKELRKDSVNNLSLITELIKAEDTMWDWMYALQPFSKVEKMSEQEAKAYLDQEMKNVQNVKQVMLESIENAENHLQKMQSNEN